MTGFNHTLIGVAIGTTIKQPALVMPLAFASHFVADSLPHMGRIRALTPWKQSFIVWLCFEAVVCFTILLAALVVWPDHRATIILGTFFATLPDFLWIPYHRGFHHQHWFYRFHARVQWGERPYGIVYELIYSAILLLLLHHIAIR